MITHKILGLLLFFSLSACSGYSNQFKCKAQEGLGCRSISEINDLVNQGFPNSNPLKKKKGKHTEDFALTASPENTLKIWIAPYQEGEHYWDEQFVLVSTTPPSLAQWQAKDTH